MMNCIKKDLIQKYIDGETSPRETARVNEHAKACEQCARQINHQRKLAMDIKRAVNLLAEDPISIPALPKTDTPAVNAHFLTRRRIIYSISAASLLLFCIIICHKENGPEIRNQITVVHCLSSEIDANRPITEQPIVINVIDASGKVTEYSEK